MQAMNYSLTRLTSSRYQLGLQGPCHNVNWVALLSVSLSAMKISMLAAEAVREEPNLWTAQFELEFRASPVGAESIDYLALIRRRPLPSAPELPRLQRFAVARRADGTLRVMADADEQSGLLERLLSRVSGLGLYPNEVKLRATRDGLRSSLALRGIGGLTPAEDTGAALETLLQRMQVRRSELVEPPRLLGRVNLQRVLR